MAYTLGFKDFYEEVEGDIKETGTSSTLEVPISKEEWKCLNKTQRKKRVLEEWNKIDDNEKDEFERIAQKIDEERIYGSVSALDIVNALKEHGIELDKKYVDLEEPIKSLGSFEVPIKLSSDKVVNIKVEVLEEK